MKTARHFGESSTQYRLDPLARLQRLDILLRVGEIRLSDLTFGAARQPDGVRFSLQLELVQDVDGDAIEIRLRVADEVLALDAQQPDVGLVGHVPGVRRHCAAAWQ